MYDHRTTAPHDKDISCGVSACVYGSQSDRERVNAYQDGCGGAREAYRGPVVHRVDDGSAGRLDRPGGVKLLPRELVPIWTQRLKAFGNGIVPQQSYAIAKCILEYDGVAVPR